MEHNRDTNHQRTTEENTSDNSLAARNADLPDSRRDAERMKPEETVLDLPDVWDIPGQEHIHVAPLGELADTTISSADEEGEGLFDDDTQTDDDAIPGVEPGSPR